MCKNQKINIALRFLVVVSLLMTALVASAEKYKVLSFKNCAPTIDGRAVGVGAIFSDSQKIVPNWNGEVKESKYIKLQNLSDGSVCVVSAPRKKSALRKDESFLSAVWRSLTGQKQCSTRVLENELFGGLPDRLSQTFYLLHSDAPGDNQEITVATELDEESLLRFSYTFGGVRREFDVPVRNGSIVINSGHFDGMNPAGEGIVLRLKADLIKSPGEIINITNTMNVILIPE